MEVVKSNIVVLMMCSSWLRFCMFDCFLVFFIGFVEFMVDVLMFSVFVVFVGGLG